MSGFFSRGWQAPVEGQGVSSEVLAAPVVGDDGVAVKSGDNQVFLLDAGDGGRKWVYQRATPPLSVRGAGSPVFADRYLFVGYPGGKLVALSLQNGAPVWEGAVALPKGATELDRVADVVASPVVDGRQICAVAFQGRVACFDMGQGGAMVWSRDISSVAGLAMDGRYLFVTDDKGRRHALDRSVRQ
jgi:outer membrane protein assembly factor BamB